jgi:hypothetical protein
MNTPKSVQTSGRTRQLGGCLIQALHSLALICLCLLARHAQAESTSYWLNVGGLSAHDHGKHNGFNPALGIEARTSDVWAFGAGMYRNSQFRTTHYAGAIYTPVGFATDTAQVRFGLQAGVVDGYQFRNGGVIPAAAAVASVRFETVSVQLAYVPAVERLKSVNTLALTFTVRLP